MFPLGLLSWKYFPLCFPSLPNNYCGKIENWLQKYLQQNFRIMHRMKLSSISFKILSQDIFLEEKNVFTKGGGAQMFGLLEKMCEIWLTDDHFCLSMGGQATKRPRTLLASLWEPWWSPFKVRWAEEEVPHLWRSQTQTCASSFFLVRGMALNNGDFGNRNRADTSYPHIYIYVVMPLSAFGTI